MELLDEPMRCGAPAGDATVDLTSRREADHNFLALDGDDAECASDPESEEDRERIASTDAFPRAPAAADQDDEELARGGAAIEVGGVSDSDAGWPTSCAPFHPIAHFFPRMRDDEYQRLKVDIQRNGLLMRIVRWRGQIIDGRHRERACRELGIAPQYTDLNEDADVAAIVRALNFERRNLTKNQKALAAARFANLRPGRPAKTPNNLGVSQADAAKEFGVSPELLRQAKLLLGRAVPTLIDLVETGGCRLSHALLVAELPREKQCELVADRHKFQRAMNTLTREKREQKQQQRRAAKREKHRMQRSIAKGGLSATRDRSAGLPAGASSGRPELVTSRKERGGLATDPALEAKPTSPTPVGATADAGTEESDREMPEAVIGAEELVGAVDVRDASEQGECAEDKWLVELPLHNLLEDTSKFDAAALLWRRVQPHVDAIASLCGFSADEVRASANGNLAARDLRLRLGFAINVVPPDQWVTCDQCKGKVTPVPCHYCVGNGFTLRHVALKTVKPGS